MREGRSGRDDIFGEDDDGDVVALLLVLDEEAASFAAVSCCLELLEDEKMALNMVAPGYRAERPASRSLRTKVFQASSLSRRAVWRAKNRSKTE